MSLVIRGIIGKKTMTDLNQVALNHKKNLKIGLLLLRKDNQNLRVETQKEDHEAVHKKRTIVTVMEVGVTDAIEEEKGIVVEAGLRVMVLTLRKSVSTVKHSKETLKKLASRQKRQNEMTAPSWSLAFISMLMKKRSISSLQRLESAR